LIAMATAVAGLLVAVILTSVTVSRLLPMKADPPARDANKELTHHLPQDPPSLEANRSLVHQPTTLVELYSLYTALCPLIVLLWWMNVTQAQAREWLRLQGLAAKSKLAKLKRAAAFFMELNNFPLLHKAIEIGSFGKKMVHDALVVALAQRAGEDSLKAALEMAERRISALERHLEDSRKVQDEQAVRREASEFSEGKLATARHDLSQQITAEVDEIRMKFQERNAKFAAVLKQRERELAAVKQQLGEFKKAAEQEASELRDIVGDLQQGSEDAAAMVREEGGRQLSKQGYAALWNSTAKGGHRKGAGQAIWQRLESASGKPKLDLSGWSGNSKRWEQDLVKEKDMGGWEIRVFGEEVVEGVCKGRREKGREMRKGRRERWDNARVRERKEMLNKEKETWQEEYIAGRELRVCSYC
ncbi:unnamed protein product, partial [Closterium sp. Naga37s-1]